jgi:uncharacterized repeat protein (TIGR01451 family)
MQKSSIWKLAALAGVVGLGFFAVFQTQRGLQDESPTEDGPAAVANGENDNGPLPAGSYDGPLRVAQGEPKTPPLNNPFDDSEGGASSRGERNTTTVTLSQDKNTTVGIQGIQGDFGGFQGSGGPRFDRSAAGRGSAAAPTAAKTSNSLRGDEIKDGFRPKIAPPAKSAGTATIPAARNRVKTANGGAAKSDDPKSLFGESIEPKRPAAKTGDSPRGLFGSKIEEPTTDAKAGGKFELKRNAPIPGGNPFVPTETKQPRKTAANAKSAPAVKSGASGPSNPGNPFGSFPSDDKAKTAPADSSGPSLSGPSTGSAKPTDSGKPAPKSDGLKSPFSDGGLTPERSQPENPGSPKLESTKDSGEPMRKTSAPAFAGNPFAEPGGESKKVAPKPANPESEKPAGNPFDKTPKPGTNAGTRDGGEPPRSLYDPPTKKADAAGSPKSAATPGTPFPDAGRKDEATSPKVAAPGPAAHTPERSDAQPRLMPVPTTKTQEPTKSAPAKTASTPTSSPRIPIVTDVGDKPAPQVTIRKTAPRSAVLGNPFVYDIFIRNVGGSTAHNVVVQDPIPSGVRLEGTDPQAYLSGRNLVWKLGTLAAGASRKISVKVTPIRGGQIGSVATVNFVAQAAARPPAQPKLMFHMQGPQRAKLGEKVTYKFTVSNVGGAAATDVWLRDVIPDGLKHPAGDDLEYKIGSLPPGKTESISLSMTVAKGGRLTNRAQITAAGGVRIEAKSAMSVAAPKLVISRTGPSQRAIGRTAVYQNMVTNGSAEFVRNATLVEAVPPGMDFVTASDGGRFDAARRTVSWSLGPLGPGKSKTVQLQLLPKQAGLQNSVVQAIGTDGSRVQTASATKVVGYAALGIDVPALDRPVSIGEQVTLRVIGRNRGTAASASVRVKVTLPEQLSLVSVRGGAKYTVAGQTVTFDTISSLPGKERAIYDLTVKAVKPGDSRVKVQIQSDEMSKPLLREEAVLVLPTNP